MKKGSTVIWAEVRCQQGFANQSFGTFATFKTNFKKPLEMPISSRKPWAGLLPLTLPQGNNSRSTPISSSWMLSAPSMTRLRMPPPWSATICYDRGPPYFFLTIYPSRLYACLSFLIWWICCYSLPRLSWRSGCPDLGLSSTFLLLVDNTTFPCFSL